MLTKFESKSNRVKGLSFHESRPWILTSLHNGVIQLWDYRMATLLDRFDEHDGPVRGIDFHKTQPLFVSGGDDYKIKVWDYKLRRCLFTLLGHLDYIRTVQFHHEYPWILSCSDDQTIRIWNWQSRSCVSVLTGHNHYVMCARFHPKEDMLVSASLDQTVRIWDTTGLRKKTVRGAPPQLEDTMSSPRVNSDIFGGTDAVVKYVLEGHERGVNWASFHPSLPLIVSGADDRQVKLWRMNETKAWEVDTMRGHTNNVSCVMFHARHELIISNSEDRSIRVWDISKRMGVQTFRRENDRFWILQSHPTQNLLAAGHDSGMIVFKLERERPALSTNNGLVYYVKERYLRVHEISSGRDTPVVSLRRTGTLGTGLGNVSRTLVYNSFNPAENNVLLCSDGEGGNYELLCFTSNLRDPKETQESRRGAGLAAVFVARNRFAVLDKNRQILIKNFQNEVTKRIVPPTGAAEGMFFAGTVGRLLLRIEDKIVLFENQSRRVLAEIQAPRVKYVVWSEDCQYVALLSKHAAVIANRQLELLCTISESVRIKSGVWNANGIFVYTTQNHIKYCLPNGDHGILRTLDVPVYLTALHDCNLYCIDREGKTRTISVDLSECKFKLALSEKKYGEVMRLIQHSRLCGQAIVTYLTEKGYPEIALHFVKDKKTRFKLAISCGNLEVALDAAYELDEEDCWKQLGIEALRQGNVQVVEMAYQRTKDFKGLSFLYLITGNREKLKKMMKIAEMRKDIMGQFHNAMFLGDIRSQVNVLKNVGQLPMALVMAQTYGLNEEAEAIQNQIQEGNGKIMNIDTSNAEVMLPPTVVYTTPENENWPLLVVNDTTPEIPPNAPEPARSRDESGGNAWGDDLDIEDVPGRSNRLSAEFVDADAGEWGDEMDLDLGDDDFGVDPLDDASGIQDTSESDYTAAPTLGKSPPAQWVANSSVAADHVAAGSFESAMQLLHRQIGIVNFRPLRDMFMAIYAGSTTSLQTSDSSTALPCYLQRSGAGTNKTLPLLVPKLVQLKEILKDGYRAFSGAKFADAQASFEYIIRAIPLLAVESDDVHHVKELLKLCREYLIGLRIRDCTTRETLEQNPVRNVELCAYFTHCKLHPSHMILTMKIAMTNAFKSRNFIAAASFSRRLLELPEITAEKHAKLRMNAKKVLQRSEKEARNENQLNYSDTKSFTLCGRSLKPIYQGDASKSCPYCETSYLTEYSGTLCDICGLSKIGEETLGLVVSATKN